MVDDRYAYVFGGRQGVSMGEAAMNDLWRYDCEAFTWEEVKPAEGSASPPEARSFHAMAACGSVLYVFGGCGVDGRLADLHSFNTTTAVWTKCPDNAAIRGRGGAGLVADAAADRVYVIAGFAGEPTRDIHCFNSTESVEEGGSWTSFEADEAFFPRSVFACATVSVEDGKPASFFLFAGEVEPSNKGHEGAGSFTNQSIMLSPKPEEDRPTMAATVVEAGSGDSLPPPRGWAPMATVGDTVVVFGGLAGDDAEPLRLNDAWSLKLR
jgi:hypothetical protein